MAQTYRIPSEMARSEVTVLRSRFICTLDRAGSVDEARRVIDRVRAGFPDASSQAYAFCAGHGATVVHGCNDGGEPKGTAGQPMLAVLRGSDLGDIVAVVTRYFGGTKLGTGGLARAFSGAVQAALPNLRTELKVDRRRVRVTVDYAHFERVKQLFVASDAHAMQEEFGPLVTFEAGVPLELLPTLQAQLRDLSGGRYPLSEVPSVA